MIYLFVLSGTASVLWLRGRPGQSRWLRPLAAALLLASYFFSTPAIAQRLLASMEARYPPVVAPVRAGDPLIVVLSSGMIAHTSAGYQPRLDEPGWERTFAAIRLWKRVGGKLLFVGEPTPDGASSVAAAMAEVAATAGVPAPAILTETQSRNTYENLAFSRALVAAHGDHVWLVTSAIHMRRAMAVAHKLGLRVRAYPCDYQALTGLHWYAWLPNSGAPALFGDLLHESVGLVYYRLKGYAD